MNYLKNINDKFILFEKIILTLCTIMLVLSIFIQVICRYILMISTQINILLILLPKVWMSYLGGGYALYSGGQIEIDIAPTIINYMKISDELKRRIILTLKTIGLSITVIFILCFCYVFSNYIMFIYRGVQTSQTMGIPMWIVYFPVLIGSLITVWHGIYRILLNIQSYSLPNTKTEKGDD